MTEEHRQHQRIKRRLGMQFSFSDVSPRQWDMSIVQDISLGGVKFTSSKYLDFKDQVMDLRIKTPDLIPNSVELQAVIVSCEPRLHEKIFDVRAKFINLTEAQKEHLGAIRKNY